MHGSAYVAILGVAQDAGVPQAGCSCARCTAARADPALRRHAACMAIVDPAAGRRWLIDATPDFRAQLARLHALPPRRAPSAPALDGVLLTHGHIGHYTGLIHLGPEAMSTRAVPVHAMPRLAAFLGHHQPWSTLVTGGHVDLRPLSAATPRSLSPAVHVTPLPVPHRDELSETVAFVVRGPTRSALYLPDIDRWEDWPRALEDVLATVDVAYLDGTFFDAGELQHRDAALVPHPPIRDTLRRLADVPPALRARVRFLHLNHTNPALDPSSTARREIEAAGCHVADEGERFPL